MSFTNSLSPALIAEENWPSLLASIEARPEIYFCQNRQLESHRTDDPLCCFLRKQPYGSPQLSASNFTYEMTIQGLAEKADGLERLEVRLRSDSRIENKTELIGLVMDEIMMNSMISAEKAAVDLGYGHKSSSLFHFMVEWNSQELWMHGQDPYGAFRRRNFQRSFRPPSTPAEVNHGYSGRGLHIIMDWCSDLYIKSAPDWGTWVAARVDLVLPNRMLEQSPKRLLLEFS